MCCIDVRRPLWRLLKKSATLVRVHVCCVSEEALEEGALFCRQEVRPLSQYVGCGLNKCEQSSAVPMLF